MYPKYGRSASFVVGGRQNAPSNILVTLIKNNIREMQFYSAGSCSSLTKNLLSFLFFSSVWAGWEPPETCDFESSSCIWETGEGEDTKDWKWERWSAATGDLTRRITLIFQEEDIQHQHCGASS